MTGGEGEKAANPSPDLGARFRRLIRTHGPMPVARFMGESNAHYYAGRDPIGATGDFVTAPEISQMFGELVGLWLTDMWDRAGRPAEIAYVELGPGRGTLARDALRVMAKHGLRPEVHFVEGSPELRRLQGAAVAGARFHEGLGGLPDDRPLLVAANEFFDALPIRQLVRTESGWRERMVALDGDAFVFAAGQQPMDAAVPTGLAEAGTGTVIETCPGAAAWMQDLASRLEAQGGAALVMDYGHLAPRTGSTLQAVRAHEKLDIFAAPGEADLTAHVDFSVLRQIAERGGLRVGTATQGEWLAAMGIGLRARTLASRSPERAPDIAAAHDRLAGAEGMGELFKVMGVSGNDWPDAAGFETVTPPRGYKGP